MAANEIIPNPAETQEIPNLEAICREAAGIELACYLGTDMTDLLDDTACEVGANDDAMGIIQACARKILEHPTWVEGAEIELIWLVTNFLAASARQGTRLG